MSQNSLFSKKNKSQKYDSSSDSGGHMETNFMNIEEVDYTKKKKKFDNSDDARSYEHGQMEIRKRLRAKEAVKLIEKLK